MPFAHLISGDPINTVNVDIGAWLHGEKDDLGLGLAPSHHAGKPKETGMYQTPELKRLGTLREITKAGTTGPMDGAATQNDGCGALGTRCS